MFVNNNPSEAEIRLCQPEHYEDILKVVAHHKKRGIGAEVSHYKVTIPQLTTLGIEAAPTITDDPLGYFNNIIDGYLDRRRRRDWTDTTSYFISLKNNGEYGYEIYLTLVKLVTVFNVIPNNTQDYGGAFKFLVATALTQYHNADFNRAFNKINVTYLCEPNKGLLSPTWKAVDELINTTHKTINTPYRKFGVGHIAITIAIPDGNEITRLGMRKEFGDLVTIIKKRDNVFVRSISKIQGLCHETDLSIGPIRGLAHPRKLPSKNIYRFYHNICCPTKRRKLNKKQMLHLADGTEIGLLKGTYYTLADILKLDTTNEEHLELLKRMIDVERNINISWQ